MIPTPITSAGAERARHPYLYLEDEPGAAVFLVEDTLFKVHRYFLKQHSPVFADMFSLPSGGMPEEGVSDELPIVLPDTKAVDFERLLSLFYTRDVVNGDLTTFEHWTSVLAFATKWQFEAHRAVAIGRLSQLGTPVERIVLARKYDIPNWLEEAYLALCMREEPLTLAEGNRLGMQDVITLAELRQRIRAYVWGHTLSEIDVKRTIQVKLNAR